MTWSKPDINRAWLYLGEPRPFPSESLGFIGWAWDGPDGWTAFAGRKRVGVFEDEDAARAAVEAAVLSSNGVL